MMMKILNIDIDEYNRFESLILKPIVNLDKVLSMSNKEDLRKNILKS